MLQNVLVLAEKLWPKATDIDFDLLDKVLANTPEDQTKSILEDARIDNKYNTVPLKYIKERVAGLRSAGSASGYIDCWAVHPDTAKFKNCMVLASNNEGANVQMQKWLEYRCHVEPTEWVIFVDDHQAFANYRVKILREIRNRKPPR